MDRQDELLHYGVGHLDGGHSGRYAWGSGDVPFQRGGDFLDRVDKLRKDKFEMDDPDTKEHLTGDRAIARSLGLTTTQLRIQIGLASDERRSEQVSRAKKLRDEGKTLQQIATEMGFSNDSSVRSLLDKDAERRMNQSKETADFLKNLVDEKGMLDVGKSVEHELGVSRTRLDQALYILEMQGYHVYGGGLPQVTNKGKQTNLKVLTKPEYQHKDIYDVSKIGTVTEYKSPDGGDTFVKKSFRYPASMSSERLKIRYADETAPDGHKGIEKDGTMEIRPGVKDLNLGNSHYAQVRILVDDTHYLKGMAVYGDEKDFPPGVDIIFNTNKKSDVPMKKVIKEIKDDPDNPFGALIKEDGGQSTYIDDDGKEKLSLINKRAEEGDWDDWSDSLPSQFLSKQSMTLMRRQLDLAKADKESELAEIEALTNPTVKKKLLESFANDCDSSAIHLQGAALPGQKYQVILPISTLKDTEIYAPSYTDGTKVALVRFPHGGTFEIPILTVNNKNPDGKRVLGNTPMDAVGINSKVAERLSGADFDGDTVMVIPTGGKIKINSTPPLKGLEGFDPKVEYGGKPEGSFREMKATGNEMGKISNLITDMTLKGADDEELARAVRHSMVVIDAAKHKLDYHQSEIDNGIQELKDKYQGHYTEDGRYVHGASTLISRSTAQISVVKKQGQPKIDPVTGKLIYKETDRVDNRTGEKLRVKSQQMAEVDDANMLSSGTPQEQAYADYANKMKALANQARKDILSAGKLNYSSSAADVYKEEVASLKAKLLESLKQAPRERKAQLLANDIVKAKKEDNPGLSAKDIKKISQQALTASRERVGANRVNIDITDREWEAIQAGAIHENILKGIMEHTDLDALREKATPRATKELSPAKINLIKARQASGYSTDEIAKSLGVSASTIKKYLKGS